LCGLAEGTVVTGRVLHRVRHDGRVHEPVVIKHLTNCSDPTVHHVRRCDHVGAGAGVAESHGGEVGEGGIVVDLAVDDQTTVTVVGVGAETDVGDDNELLAELILERSHSRGHQIVLFCGGASVGPLDGLVRHPEEEHRSDAEFEVPADRIHQPVDRLVIDVAGNHEMRLYEHPGVDAGLRHQISEDRRHSKASGSVDQFLHNSSASDFIVGSSGIRQSMPSAAAACRVVGPRAQWGHGSGWPPTPSR